MKKKNADAKDRAYKEVSASTSAAVAYHARLCDVAASLIRARDACARTLVRLAVDGVVSVFGVNDFITVSKSDDAGWDVLLPAVVDAIKGSA